MDLVGTEFQIKVWRELSRIPFGETRTYKQVAEALGGWGTRVSKPEKIISALKEAISITESGKPALVEFITKENFDFSKYE